MRRIAGCLLAIALMAVAFAPVAPALAAGTPIAGQVNTSSTPLNVRAQPTTGSAVTGSLARGSYVTLLALHDGWWSVQLPGGARGYCSARYIAEVAESQAMAVATAWSPLNIRSGPSTGYNIHTRLNKGTQVVKISASGGWARILYDGTRLGYASLTYLLAGGASSAPASQTYAPLSLSVPYFKQMDSRWASVEVGSSGRTIADIGCATTALSMAESYRTGGIITPDVMEGALRYTAGGAVYWPSAYAVTGAVSTAELYNRLKAGVPVIVGAKNQYGSTHFVVVTGFSGGDSLSSARFAILDPGTGSRTTLSAFLSAYPSMYRTVYAK